MQSIMVIFNLEQQKKFALDASFLNEACYTCLDLNC